MSCVGSIGACVDNWLMDKRKGPPLNSIFTDPLAEFFQGGNGPSHDVLDRKLVAAGLRLRTGDYSKQRKVIDAISTASDIQVEAFVREILPALERHSNSSWGRLGKTDVEFEALKKAAVKAGYVITDDYELIGGEERNETMPARPDMVAKSATQPVEREADWRPPTTIKQPSEAKAAIAPKEIFLVHGHDEKTRMDVSEFVHEWFGIVPTVLHKQINRGMALIEKFETHSSNAACAIVIMTPDDEGRAKNNISAIEKRARQNVVFELGYFYGKLQRDHVIVLDFGVDLPGDLVGLVDLRKADWKTGLLSELIALGFKTAK